MRSFVAGVLQGALGKYKALQVDAQVLEDMLATEKKKLNDVSKSGSQTMSVGAILGDDPAEVQAQKKELTEAQITNLTPVVEQAYDSIEIAKSDILADLDRFNAGQIEDWRMAYGVLADANIDYYASVRPSKNDLRSPAWLACTDERRCKPPFVDPQVPNAMSPPPLSRLCCTQAMEKWDDFILELQDD